MVAWLARDGWLGWFGAFLDSSKPPVKTEIIVVLAGGWTGERVLKAGELVRDGYAPRAILDSPRGLMYGASECELSRAYAAGKGFPPGPFECLEMNATSTAEEAVAVAAELRRRGVRSCLVVSSRSHMRRAERIFRRTMPWMELHFTGAESPLFRLEQWHHVREGRKAVFLEWVKTVTEPFGI
jgi:uncharacterized SAM-binding protein YcdF (DUF218 family)